MTGPVAAAVPADLCFLSVEQVLYIHDDLLRRYGGSPSPGHRGEVEGVSAAVLAVENSTYEDAFELAAAYAVYIVMGHVFGDGNKRAGSGAALTFLQLNGVTLRVPPPKLRDAMLELHARAEKRPRESANELVAWMTRRLRTWRKG
jgi:death-on-curing family protein